MLTAPGPLTQTAQPTSDFDATLGTSLAASLYFLAQGGAMIGQGMSLGTVRSLLALMGVPDGGLAKKAVATKLSGFAQFKKRGRAGAGKGSSDEPLQRELNAVMAGEHSVLGDGGAVRVPAPLPWSPSTLP